jgi:hypothetical protein
MTPGPIGPTRDGSPAAAPAPAPTPVPSAPNGGSAAPDTTPNGLPPRDNRIQVQDLTAPDPNATGVIDEAHGGFGSDMWAGATIGVVQKILPMMPAATPWRSLQRLERKLLLSAAAVPIGHATGEPLIKLRADRLWALGDVDGLAALLKGLPDPVYTADLRRLQIDAALVQGDTGTACQPNIALRLKDQPDSYAAKLQVFCQFATGRKNEAGLGVDLLREQKLQDPAFFAAADALAGVTPGKIDGLSNPGAVTLAMVRAAKLPLPEAVAAGPLPAPFLRAIAADPAFPLETRLVAAERAEAVGIVDAELLRQLFEQVTFSAQELSGPLSAAGTDKGVRSRALLFRAAQQQTLPAAKVEIIARALSLAGDSPAFFTAARLYAPQIAGLHAAPDLAGFAPTAVRALLAAGRREAVQPWVGVIRGSADQSGSVAALWPLLRLAGEESGPSIPSGTLAAWRKGRADLPAPAQQRRLMVGYSLLTALGDKIPPDDWLALFDAPAFSQAPAVQPAGQGSALRSALWHGLRTSIDDLRLGETVLFALATLGDSGVLTADPTDLYRVVAALHLIGLDGDARALAVEAAIANGV